MSAMKQYLGDGVYVDFDGYAIVVTTEDGIRATNVVVFEPEVIAAFENYIERLRARTNAGNPKVSARLPT